MKKNIFIGLFLFSVSPSAWALSDIEISGELDAQFSLWNLPTGQRGESAFQIPALFLNLQTPLKNDNILVMQLEGSETQGSSTERFSVKTKEAYLDLVSPFERMHAMRVGLIPQIWQEAQYEDYTYRYLGTSAWAPSEKWNYMTSADLGLSFMSEMPWDLGEYAFSISNGEGAREKEQGPHKEFSLFGRFILNERWGLNLNYVRGSYEKYADNLKERIQALFTYRKEDYSLGLEILSTQDSSDAFSDYSLADNVNVSNWAGRMLRGEAVSFYGMIKTGPQAEVLLRYDYLNPVRGESGKDLRTAVVALSYGLSSDIRVAFVTDYTWYGESFAPGVRDQSKVSLASQVVF